MRLLLVAILLLTIGACGFGRSPQPKSAETHYQEGEVLFERGRYEDAIASWEKARDSFQSAELNTRAELKIAEAYLRGGQYEEAATAYVEFLRQYPNHPETAANLFHLGTAYDRLKLSHDRDQTATRQALDTFERLLRQFPDAPQIPEAQKRIVELREWLTAHELYVGRFYVRTKKPEAAIARLTALLENHPRHGGRDEALFLLGQAYLLQGKAEVAAEHFETLYQDYPDSGFIDNARKAQRKHQ